MRFLRFVFPFLFERNWVDGSWELSKSRLTLFLMGAGLILIGVIAAVVLQTPVVYENSP